MRSRYSAYALHNELYLQQSWHSSTRPATLELPVEMQWLGLHVIDAPAPEGNQGWVEFSARFQHAGRVEQLRERSRFVYEEGHWFYMDGLIHDNTKPAKIGRNDPCPCGSGGKYKRCCGSSG
jgi:SEC-C motif-containing protein